ncbi:hypothetical protein [Bacillus alkalicellulosilyticus]|uniref:hypothetical protein n=1 Tax=Alkalihalobacterium alkalicellulosilyticum TaxID=1912214 RepID=UPI00148368E7|nr:hypothetical protein [Bacillus alkalicellulosilyticus]
MNIFENVTEEKFAQLLTYFYEKGNNEYEMKVSDFIQDIVTKLEQEFQKNEGSAKR